MRISQSGTIILLIITVFLSSESLITQGTTYAEKLGFPEGKKVLILHVDDAGMSWSSNKGTIDAIEKGVANSFSIMMPCAWVPEIARYVNENPEVDAGLHLTLTSEWKNYRWGPLMGKPMVPGLVDKEGCMWPSVQQVVENASPDEVEAEIRAQVERALNMGFRPTHLDSHMGTLFATSDFLERYIKVGIDYKIPVMLPGGHNSFLKEDLRQEAIAELKAQGNWEEGMEVPEPEIAKMAPVIGEKIWNAGLPVLDDLHNVSYGWDRFKGEDPSDDELQEYFTEKYIESISTLQPGLTMVIMHCTWPSEIFKDISSSGLVRKGDLLAMMDPEFEQFLEDEEIILTTWREVMERRQQIN